MCPKTGSNWRLSGRIGRLWIPREGQLIFQASRATPTPTPLVRFSLDPTGTVSSNWGWAAWVKGQVIKPSVQIRAMRS